MLKKLESLGKSKKVKRHVWLRGKPIKLATELYSLTEVHQTDSSWPLFHVIISGLRHIFSIVEMIYRCIIALYFNPGLLWDDILEFPEDGWEDICKATPSSPFEFGMSHIVAYFVIQSVTGGKVAGDLKPLTSQPRICLSVAMERTFNVLKSTWSFTLKPSVSQRWGRTESIS